MSTIQLLYVGNDTVLELERLKNDLTGEYVNEATVSVTLVEHDGVVVAGDTWPKAMPYVPGSEGAYRTILSAGLALVANRKYEARITVDAGNGLRAAWTVACVARVRS